MPRVRAPFAVALLAAAVSSSCAPGVGHGVDQYREGRYYAALRTFRRLEPAWQAQAPQRRVDYALYRGLTHLALREQGPATYWLATAWRLHRGTPGTLGEGRMDEWRRGWVRVAGPAAREPGAPPQGFTP